MEIKQASENKKISRNLRQFSRKASIQKNKKFKYSPPKQVQKNESQSKNFRHYSRKFVSAIIVLDIVPDFDLDFLLIGTLASSHFGAQNCLERMDFGIFKIIFLL